VRTGRQGISVYVGSGSPGIFQQRPNLYRAPPSCRYFAGDFDGFVEVLSVQKEESAQLLAGFGKGPVGQNTFSTLRAEWRRILQLYDALDKIQPSPIIALNRAVAVAMVDGASRALEVLEAIAAEAELENFHLLHAAGADLLRRIGDSTAAATHYRRALALVSNDAERRYLAQRLQEVEPSRG
jgi:hypothetical protein